MGKGGMKRKLDEEESKEEGKERQRECCNVFKGWRTEKQKKSGLIRGRKMTFRFYQKDMLGFSVFLWMAVALCWWVCSM